MQCSVCGAQVWFQNRRAKFRKQEKQLAKQLAGNAAAAVAAGGPMGPLGALSVGSSGALNPMSGCVSQPVGMSMSALNAVNMMRTIYNSAVGVVPSAAGNGSSPSGGQRVAGAGASLASGSPAQYAAVNGMGVAPLMMSPQSYANVPPAAYQNSTPSNSHTSQAASSSPLGGLNTSSLSSVTRYASVQSGLFGQSAFGGGLPMGHANGGNGGGGAPAATAAASSGARGSLMQEFAMASAGFGLDGGNSGVSGFSLSGPHADESDWYRSSLNALRIGGHWGLGMGLAPGALPVPAAPCASGPMLHYNA